MKPKQPPKITDNELYAIAIAIKNNPNQTIFRPSHSNGLLHTAYYFKNKALVVFEGEIIGRGNWGTVNICSKSSLQRKDDSMIVTRLNNSSCIIKKPLPGLLHTIKNIVTNISLKMQNEALINDMIYGDSDWLDAGELGIITLQPFLGDLTLDNFLVLEQKNPTLDFSSWLTIFIQLTNNIDVIHQKTGLINNDIKPENILLSLAKDNSGNFETPLRVLAVTIVDWGNAHPKYELHLPGDMHYASPVSCYLFKPLRNEKIDTFAMGKMFLEMLAIAKKPVLTTQHEELITTCEALFKKMVSNDQVTIPPLRLVNRKNSLAGAGVIETLRKIKNTLDEKPYLNRRDVVVST